MNNPNPQLIAAFFAAWWLARGAEPQPLAAVAHLAPEALQETIGATTPAGLSRRLGMVLRGFLGRPVGGYVLQRVTGPVSGSVTHYQVRQVPCGAGTALDAPTGKESRR